MSLRIAKDVSSAHWRVVAASVEGTAHAENAQACQDTHLWSVRPDGALAVAVADGASSAPLGQVGSAVATESAIAALRDRGSLPGPFEEDSAWKEILGASLNAARRSLEAEACRRDVAVGDLATTLILIVATHEIVAAAQVGDGAVVMKEGRDTVLSVTKPQIGEYVNETTFLTSPSAISRAQIVVRRNGVDRLALLTDGLQMLALNMPGGTPHAPFFDPLFRFVQEVDDEEQARNQLVAFLRSSRIRARTDDDITLVLATPMK